MAIELGKGIGTTVETPVARQRKGALTRVGEFLAPTVTGLITGEKKLTPRTAAGAAFEVGSFAIPAGAIARGFGFAARGARAITQAGKARRVVKPSELETLQRGTRELAQRTKQVAKTGAQVGGVTGGLAAGGRALGEEDRPLTEVLGQAAIGGGVGALGGALIAPAVALTTAATKGIAGITSNAFRKVQTQLNPQVRTQAIDDLTTGLSKSFVENNPTVLKKLEKISNIARRKGQDLDETDLLREVAESGYQPKVEGDLGRFGASIKDANARIGRLSEGVADLAKPIKQKTSLASIQQQAAENLRGRTDIDFASAERQFKSVFPALKREFGNSLSASDLNTIRIKMNKKAKGGEKFVQDVNSAIGSAARLRLDEFTPAIRQLNAESSKLFRVIDTMEALSNRKIDVGFWSTALGRYLGVVVGAGVGIAGGGVGGLVIAGALAQAGSRTVGLLIRQGRFNPELQKIIQTGIRSDKKLLNKLLKEATPEDKALIQRAVGKTP